MAHAVGGNDALSAMASSLQAPLQAVTMSAALMKSRLVEGDGDLPIEPLDSVIEQSSYVVGVLRDLARAGDPEVVNALAALRSADVVALEEIRLAALEATRREDAAALEELRIAALEALRVAEP
jgi:hypothetical protein